MPIHPTAIVDAGARVHDTADIGPYCVIGAEVHVGARTAMKAHVYAEGPTWIGDDNLFYPYASVGVASQDLKYKGERAETHVGHRNLIREFVTIHRGTEGGGAVTRIGDDNLLMAYTHVAHDCQVGSHCVFGNGATLGGHVTVGDWARVSAFVGVHQFCRIGEHAIIGGYSVVTRDVLPYSTTSEEREAKLYRANTVGLERRGFEPGRVEQLNRAFRILRDPKLNTAQALEKIRAEVEATPEVADLVRFAESSERGFIK